MKIITDNAVYVQKIDMTILNQLDLAIPPSIFMKVSEGTGIVIIDHRNSNEFVKFDAPEEIEFFKSIDWIIDFNEVKDLSEEERTAFVNRIVVEKFRVEQKLNSMTQEERKENMNMVSQYNLLDFKLDSLIDFFWVKQGNIELPADFKQEKKIRKQIKTKFNK